MAASHEAPQNLADAAQTVYKALNSQPISLVLRSMRAALGPAAPLLAVHEDTPLAEVLATMREADIVAVPVYRAPEGEPLGRIYTGIVGIYDILANTVFQRMFDDMDVTKAFDMSEPEFQKYLALMEQEQVYFSTKVGELVGRTYESSESWAMHSSDPISSLLQLLTSARYHRVLVIDDEAIAASASAPDFDGFGPTAPPTGSSIRLVTQTDLVAYLTETAAALTQEDATPNPSLSKAYRTILSAPVNTVNEIATTRLPPSGIDANQPILRKGDTPSKRVVTVPDSMSALAALRCMYIHRVLAVAVINAEGGLVANLSASDLRGLTISNLETLINPVFEFLESTERRPTQLKSDQLRIVHPNTALDIAVNKMLNDHIHRVWIADPNDCPIGVVSLTDVLSMFVPENNTAVDV